jgi:hypothetical protein
MAHIEPSKLGVIVKKFEAKIGPWLWIYGSYCEILVFSVH